MNPKLEDLLMALRYCYYVEGLSVVTDHQYDYLERTADKILPPGSPIHLPGSDSKSSYTPEQIKLAEDLKKLYDLY